MVLEYSTGVEVQVPSTTSLAATPRIIIKDLVTSARCFSLQSDTVTLRDHMSCDHAMLPAT